MHSQIFLTHGILDTATKENYIVEHKNIKHKNFARQLNTKNFHSI